MPFSPSPDDFKLLALGDTFMLLSLTLERQSSSQARKFDGSTGLDRDSVDTLKYGP